MSTCRNKRDNTPPGCDGQVIAAVVLMAAVITMLCLLPSCGTKRIATSVEAATTASATSIRRDTVRVYVTVRDSVTRRDSVSTVIQGDTVRIERWHYTDRWHASDTARNTSHAAADTVRYEVTRTVTDTVEVPAKLSRWQLCRMMLGDGMLFALAVAAVCAVIWWRRKKT